MIYNIITENFLNKTLLVLGAIVGRTNGSGLTSGVRCAVLCLS